jgi:hypothetical protein
VSAAGNDWVDQLPAELNGQRAILRGLMRACAADDAISWLVIGCSLGRGAADRWSDLDLAMGVSDEDFDADFDAAVSKVRHLVDGLGDLVESYQHKISGLTTAHERIFAQYADRCQVDLVVFRDSEPVGSVRDLVILYDPAERVRPASERHPVTPEQVREWAFGAWCALADLGKYLRRRSWWEALDRLAEARGQFWRLWAAALGVPNPQYGLTSILDFAPGRVPAGIESTVSDLDPGRLQAAASSLARQLSALGEQLPPALRAALPAAMGRYVSSDLEDIVSAEHPA